MKLLADSSPKSLISFAKTPSFVKFSNEASRFCYKNKERNVVTRYVPIYKEFYRIRPKQIRQKSWDGLDEKEEADG